MEEKEYSAEQKAREHSKEWWTLASKVTERKERMVALVQAEEWVPNEEAK